MVVFPGINAVQITISIFLLLQEVLLLLLNSSEAFGITTPVSKFSDPSTTRNLPPKSTVLLRQL